MKINSPILRITWTVLCFIAVSFFAMIAFMQYNWHNGNETGSMNVIIVTAFMITIISRLLKTKIILMIYIIISDITLIIVSNRGIISGKFWIQFYQLIQSPVIIVFLLSFGILFSDWYIRFKHFENQN